MPVNRTHVLVACALFAPTSSAIAEFISASLNRSLKIDASLRGVTNAAARRYASITARAASAALQFSGRANEIAMSLLEQMIWEPFGAQVRDACLRNARRAPVDEHFTLQFCQSQISGIRPLPAGNSEVSPHLTGCGLSFTVDEFQRSPGIRGEQGRPVSQSQRIHGRHEIPADQGEPFCN